MEIKVGGLHFNHYGKSTTQLPPFSSQQNIFHENGHQGIPCLVEDLEIQFPAQRKTEQLIIMAVGICFATEQRKNAYYRNDPIKYGLTAY